MQQHPASLPNPVVTAILKHCARETEFLKQVDQLSRLATSNGPTAPGLMGHQSDLTALADRAQELRKQRQLLREVIASHWNCPPGEVRLSRIVPAEETEGQQLHQARQTLLQQVLKTGTHLRTAEQTLTRWHRMVSDLLATLLEVPATSERYGPNGSRVASTWSTGIEVRS